MLSTPTNEQAERFMRSVELSARLRGGILTPMAGTRPMNLTSLREVADFLVVQPDVQAILHQSPLAQVRYIDPGTISTWVGDVIGDAELAEALDAVVDTSRPFGFLVPEIKSLLAERIAQCDEILQPQAEEVG